VIVLLEKKFTGGGLGLNQFSFHLGPFVKRMQVIYHLVSEMARLKIKGGAILCLLEQKISENSG